MTGAPGCAMTVQGMQQGDGRMRKAMLAGLALLMLGACAGDRRLHDLDRGLDGPDEFSVLPSLPLEIPASLVLPSPDPGGVNRVDRNPIGEGLLALGGSPAGGVAGDQALLSAVAADGVTSGIRSLLAQEDAAFRGRAGLAAGWNPFGRDRYFRSYAGQALDASSEIARWRNLGAQVPSAPPEG